MIPSSMQLILKKALRPGDGYSRGIDITQVEVKAGDPQGPGSYIKTSALNRIYYEFTTEKS